MRININRNTALSFRLSVELEHTFGSITFKSTNGSKTVLIVFFLFYGDTNFLRAKEVARRKNVRTYPQDGRPLLPSFATESPGSIFICQNNSFVGI